MPDFVQKIAKGFTKQYESRGGRHHGYRIRPLDVLQQWLNIGGRTGLTFYCRKNLKIHLV